MKTKHQLERLYALLVLFTLLTIASCTIGLIFNSDFMIMYFLQLSLYAVIIAGYLLFKDHIKMRLLSHIISVFLILIILHLSVLIYIGLNYLLMKNNSDIEMTMTGQLW
jgi:hypothetical protein